MRTERSRSFANWPTTPSCSLTSASRRLRSRLWRHEGSSPHLAFAPSAAQVHAIIPLPAHSLLAPDPCLLTPSLLHSLTPPLPYSLPITHYSSLITHLSSLITHHGTSKPPNHLTTQPKTAALNLCRAFVAGSCANFRVLRVFRGSLLKLLTTDRYSRPGRPCYIRRRGTRRPTELRDTQPLTANC